MRTRPGFGALSSGSPSKTVPHTLPRPLGVRSLAAVLVLLVGLAEPALAGADDEAQAAGHVRKAAAALDLGNYADAAREYEAAYMSTSDPQMLVGVGQAWQMAGERQKALTAFRSYVRIAPTGDQRANCEARIRELDNAPSPAPAVPPPYAWQPEPPPTGPGTSVVTCPPAAARPAESGQSAWPFWTAVGAVVITGMVLGYLYFRQDGELAMPGTTFGAKQF